MKEDTLNCIKEQIKINKKSEIEADNNKNNKDILSKEYFCGIVTGLEIAERIIKYKNRGSLPKR